MASDFFQNLARWKVQHGGTAVMLPYPYYDTLSLSGVYTASTAAVRRLLPHPDLFPVELWPGRCLAAFTAFEYRQVEDGPYNEVAISFMVSHKRRKLPFFSVLGLLGSLVIPNYVWQLPVTTEAARSGGVDLWGFPKFIARIHFNKGPEWVECVLALPQAELLRLRARVLPTRAGRLLRYVNYSLLQDVLVVSNTLIHPLEFAQSLLRPDMQLTIGDGHPLCQALRDLQLSRQPLVYQYSPKNESLLFAGRNLADM